MQICRRVSKLRKIHCLHIQGDLRIEIASLSDTLVHGVTYHKTVISIPITVSSHGHEVSRRVLTVTAGSDPRAVHMGFVVQWHRTGVPPSANSSLPYQLPLNQRWIFIHPSG